MNAGNTDVESASSLSIGNIEKYLDIDEILGDKKGRYFGDGFRRVTYDINNIEINTENTAHIRVNIHYPSDWSSKQHGQVSLPHLSTVDAAPLASVLGEWYMHHFYEIDNTLGIDMQLISCEIKSGTTPNENLINLPERIKEVKHEKLKSKSSLFKGYSELSIQFGGMNINLKFAHSGKKCLPPGSYNFILNNHNHKYTHANHKAISGYTRIDIKNININKNNKTAHANLIFESDNAEYRDLSLVEIALVSAQLAQSLIYRVDDIDRSRSNTLWMRDFMIEQVIPFKVKHEQQILLNTVSHKRLHNDGVAWSIFRFICCIGAICTSFTFAHQLPRITTIPRSTHQTENME